MTSPDGDAVYGSMNDYFKKMSSGNVVISATLLNRLDEDLGLPIWITLPYSKSDYHKYVNGSIFDDPRTYAGYQGISVGTLDEHNKLVIIYSGNRYNRYTIGSTSYMGQLNPAANSIGGTVYIMSELEDAPMDQESGGAKFARIGTHCHEFAHLLGIKHSSGSRADIMEAGNRNGNYAAPAPLNPIARMSKGWLTPIKISGQQQYDTYYSLTAPQVYRINSDANGDYFLIENRRFNQMMTIGSYSLSDYNNKDFMPIAWTQNSSNSSIDEGILVWRIRGYYPSGNYDDNGLVYASGIYNQSYPDKIATDTDAGDPFPGDAGVNVFSPWSDTRSPYGVEPGHYTLYVPTSSSGTNVGMEILNENTSSGYYTVMFYQSNPADASPSKPKNLRVTNSSAGPVMLAWDANSEPDLSSYEVWRTDPTQGFPWSLITTTSSTTFTDNQFWYYSAGNDEVQYKVRAKDTDNKLSVFSDVASCRAEPMFKTGGNWSDRQKPENETHAEDLSFNLISNYPNPFNPITTISYSIPMAAEVHLAVFDFLGREVALLVEGFMSEGMHSVTFDGSLLSSGIYFYTLQSGKSIATKKLVLMK